MARGQAVFVANAFTREAFGGNPAAVMVLDDWPADDRLLSIAAQHNLSETAFLVPQAEDHYELRWFTPAAEVDLCGHATLASAHILREQLGFTGDSLHFTTRKSGVLEAHFSDDGIELDFPAIATVPHVPEPALTAALGCDVIGAAIPTVNPWKALYEVADESVVRNLRPDISALARAVPHGVIVTAAGRNHDFVSRFFAPNLGVDEDPVTGSAHCVLAPYWGVRLGKTELRASQVSPRGGELLCRLDGERVRLQGQCVTYLSGQILVDL